MFMQNRSSLAQINKVAYVGGPVAIALAVFILIMRKVLEVE
jgi:hypothetical protein